MRAFRVLVALLPVLVVLTVFLLLSGGRRPAPAPWHRTFTPVPGTRTPVAHPLPPGHGALIALVTHRTELRSSPGGHILGSVGLRDRFGSPQILLVAQSQDGWLGVVSELAGNGKLGWVPEAATALGRDPYTLRASLAHRLLTVLRDGRVVARYTVGVGAQDAPTPTGRFAVTDRLTTNDRQGPYGCCILALSATAPHAIPGWTGGNRIAIHATPDNETIGQPDSHGCLHVTQAEGHWLIHNVPLGTPTVITS